MNERHIKEMVLGTVNQCGSCGHSYGVDNVAIVGHEDELWLLMMNCPACSSRGLVAALIKDQTRPALASDVVEKELQGVKKFEVVTADDVLDIHQFLKEFSGDFLTLFGKRQ